MLSKKGSVSEDLWFRLFEIVLLVAAVTTFLLIVNNAIDDESFYKKYYAMDNALLVDAMHGIPGDANITYALEKEFLVKFEKSWVSTGDNPSVKHPYASSLFQPAFEQEILIRNSYDLVKDEEIGAVQK